MSIATFLSKMFRSAAVRDRAPEAPSPLDYDQMVLLDAEDLAEQGIARAYEDLHTQLRQYVSNPAPVADIVDPDIERYAIRVNGKEQLVYGPELPGSDHESWGRATYLFFQLINEQLSNAPVRFYALNGGNDLGGMFLTNDQLEAARSALPRKSDWPYLPEQSPPWWGQFHQ